MPSAAPRRRKNPVAQPLLIPLIPLSWIGYSPRKRQWFLSRPVGRFAIFDDRAGGRRVVFIESDATSHVEKVPDRGSFVGRFTHLRNDSRDLPVRIENSFADQNPLKKPEH